MKISYRFPKRFVWGVATAAPQIEGAAFEDSKGESVWDRFSRVPGKVANGDTLDVACDHYHRYREDFALMKRLGYRHYRLSVAWPRIVPTGRGAVNPKGLDFYDRLMDSMLEHGITPWVTMFHWDLPQALEQLGGWRVRVTSDAFAQYAQIIVKRLGDRVHNWMTLNEIPCFIGLGYGAGVHAPGAKEPSRVLNQAYHHALLCHGHGIAAVREYGRRGARVGLVHNPETILPITESAADIRAARAEFVRSNGQIMGPIFRGKYPKSLLQSPDAPRVERGDMAIIGAKTDFLGLNLYAGRFVRAGKDGQPEGVSFRETFPTAELPWIKITPQTVYWAIRHSVEGFGASEVYITENGCCYKDGPNGKGEIIDLGRREYYRNYLISLHRAVDEGFNVRGYFAWSFMDNFEWAEGYKKRFGLVYVDFSTQRRIPKLSAHWYSRVIRENRVL